MTAVATDVRLVLDSLEAVGASLLRLEVAMPLLPCLPNSEPYAENKYGSANDAERAMLSPYEGGDGDEAENEPA
jgi:hypothetical protein